MKRMVLVSVHPAPSPQSVPLACGFLKAALAVQPVSVRLLDCFLSDPVDDCVSRIAALKPTAVGFSIYLWNRKTCWDIAARLRTLLPSAVIFCGGPEVTAAPENILASGPFDFIVVGEGEQTLADVCRIWTSGADFAEIPGIASMQVGRLKFVPRSPLRELDTIPSPWLTGVLDAASYPGILWQLSRGCGFSCDFCFDSRDRYGVRRFSLERVEAELRHFVDKGVSQVFVLDSTFNQDVSRAKEILRLIGRVASHIHFHFEVRSEFLDAEMAGLFAATTCSLQIGLQSADPVVLKGVGRAFEPGSFTQKISLLNESGATFGFDLIYGLPGDTLDGFRASLDYALGLYPNHLDIFPLALLPGTALAARSARLGLEHLPQPPYTLLASPTFPAADLLQAARLGRACDIFYTRGRAVAWFNGMLDALHLAPSLFLGRFAGWLEKQGRGTVPEEEMDDGMVWELQRGFLEHSFGGHDVKRFLPAVLDLATYHHHYAAALVSPVAGTAPVPENLTAQLLALAPGARIARFSYDIAELLDAGAADVRGITRHLRRCGSWAVIYPAVDGVRTELLDECYCQLLERLDGSTTAMTIARAAGLRERDARDFLCFAWEEGIIESAGVWGARLESR